MKIRINTGDGTNQIKTEKIKGELVGIVVSFEGISKIARTAITITSELGYTLLSCRDFWETEYIPLKARVKTNNEKLQTLHFADQWESFFLDEKLLIQVEGQTNQDVEIILKTR